MPRMTPFEFAEFCRRQSTVKVDSDGGEERESDLHEYVAGRCRANGWLFFHGSMAHRTHRTLGEFDFVVAAERGVTLFVECKSKTGKVTPEQQAVIAMASRLGHSASVISSRNEWDALEKAVKTKELQ